MNINILLAGFDPSNIPVSASVPWLVIGLLAFSAAVGVYNFLQMRKMQKKNRPKPNQLDGTIADEGISFYDLAGSPHVHANITDIWQKETQAIKKKSGGFLGIGKTSQVTGYRYYAKFAAFIGNRIEKLIAINFDNRKWLTRRPGESEPNLAVYAPNLYGENEGGVDGLIDVFIGTPNQQPSEVYQQYLPLVSGYPYQSYLVFHSGSDNKGFYLGNSGYMKEMLLWVKRTRVRNDGREQWYKVRGDGAVVCEIGAFKNNMPNISITPYHLSESMSWDIGVKSGSDSGVVEIDLEYDSKIYQTSIVEPIGQGDIDGRDAIFNFQCLSSSDDVSTYVSFWVQNSATQKTLNLIGLNVLQVTEIEYEFNTFTEYVCVFKKSFSVSILSSGNSVNYLNCIYRVRYFNPFIDANDLEAPTFDINPVHKIREILTDDAAMSKPESDVNNVNFIKAADRIYDEGLGISWAVDEKSCIEAIEELCYHIEAGIRVNRQTGLFEMVLFRDDWFAEDEIHDISENKIKDLSLEVMNSDDIVNQLNVTYYDRERIKNSTFSVYENGSILTMGHANAESVEFPYFMSMRNAEIVANWKLKQFSTPAWSGSFSTGWREARKWNRYDLIRLPWSSKWNGTILVRIMKINLGNGSDNTVTIDFEEVIPYSSEMNTSIVVDDSMNPGVQPPQPSINAVFEAPYYMTILRTGQTNADLELSNNPDIGYVAAIAAKPQSNSLNALLYTDGGVDEFEQVSRLDYCDILQLDQPIIETTSSFTVTGSLTQIANSNNLILLNDELMGFVSFDNETKVLTVKRGVLDTVPKKHSSGSLFVFDLPDVAFDSTQYAQSEVVEVQVLTTTPSGIQELSGNSQAIEIRSRAIRPYPPANVKFNDAYYPESLIVTNDIVLTWAHRNRVQQTGGEVLSWYDSDVAAESGATYAYELVSENVVLDSMTEISTNTVTILSSVLIPNKPHRLKLWSVRDGYESYQVFEHSFFAESASLILTATTDGSSVTGNTVPMANISVNVDESLSANMQFDGSSISGKAEPGSTITIEIQE